VISAERIDRRQGSSPLPNRRGERFTQIRQQAGGRGLGIVAFLNLESMASF
jgi:hypothetical protein